VRLSRDTFGIAVARSGTTPRAPGCCETRPAHVARSAMNAHGLQASAGSTGSKTYAGMISFATLPFSAAIRSSKVRPGWSSTSSREPWAATDCTGCRNAYVVRAPVAASIPVTVPTSWFATHSRPLAKDIW
jgi:hypothetical protein